MRLVNADKYKQKLLSGYMAATADDDERAIAAYEDALGCLDSAATIETESVVHAHWVRPVPGDGDPYCSHCKNSPLCYIMSDEYEFSDYCPHCGAAMGKEAQR